MLTTNFKAKKLSPQKKSSSTTYKKKLLLTFFCLIFSLVILIPSFTLRSLASNTTTQSQFSNDEDINALAALTRCSNINLDPGFFVPRSVAIGDIDGDGKLDIVIGSNATSSVSVLRNIGTTGSALFAPRINLVAGINATSVVIRDIDGDGKVDLAVANAGGADTVSILRNTSTPGNISFATKVSFATGAQPVSLAAGDIDGDGSLDLVTANNTASTASVLRNTSTPGNISFVAKMDLVTGFSPQSALLGDIDGDGKIDLAIGNFGSSVSSFRSTSSPGTISFATKVDFTVGGNPRRGAIGDIDGDGKLDLAFADSSNNNRVFTLRNTSNIGTISFATQNSFTVGSTFGITIGDIDGDGKLDLAATNQSTNNVAVLRNTSNIGTISFATQSAFPIGLGSSAIANADLDGDGKIDLVATNDNSNTISVLKSTSTVGSISFNTTILENIFPTGTSPFDLTTGDVDGDGKLDLITANRADNTVSVLRNTTLNGSVSFATKVDFATGIGPRSVAIGDIDGDGKADLVVGNSNNNTGGASTISVLRNTSTVGVVSFAPQVTFTVGANPSSVAIGDIDGDGKLDVVVANANVLSNNPIQTVSALRNTSSPGNISFDTQLTFSVGSKPGTVAIGDIDGDGKADLVVANSDNISNVNVNPDTISVLRNISSVGVISFDNQVTFPIGDIPNGIAIGDIDGDGKLDVVAGSTNTNNTSIFRNTSTSGVISFATRIDLNTGSGLKIPRLGDIDGDGKLDIAVTKSNEAKLGVFQNTSSVGSISFATRIDFSTGQNPFSIAVIDVNSDSRVDIITANLTDNTVSVLRNVCQAAILVNNNTLYVADTLNNRIQRSINNGMSWQMVGNGAGIGLGQFNAPKAVAANFTDTLIFVADTANNRVQRSTDGGSTWAIIATPGTAVNQVNSPSGLAYDQVNNKLYIADTANNRILVAANASNTTPVFTVFASATAGTTVGKVSQPQSVAVNASGMVYVADTLNNRIQMNATGLDSGWTVIASAGAAVGQVNTPKGVYVDDSGKIWVADTANNRIQVNTNGVWSVFMSAGTAVGTVNRPESMVVNSSGNLFIADTGNNRIQSKPVAGGTTTVVGQPGLSIGQFNQPSGIR